MQALFSTMTEKVEQPMTDFRRLCLEAEGKNELDTTPVVEGDDGQPEDPYAGEIKKLEDALFDGHPLVSGSCINITLQELLKICPRKRRRKDSFQGLQKSLNKMGVTLNIKSRKNEKSLVNG
jgi:hypothetical protein